MEVQAQHGSRHAHLQDMGNIAITSSYFSVSHPWKIPIDKKFKKECVIRTFDTNYKRAVYILYIIRSYFTRVKICGTYV